ncbi:MAG: hypothetical protein ACLP05_00220 [Candidatus Kryptoniota bacterium]
MSVYIAEIDKQHKSLVRLINLLDDSMKQVSVVKGEYEKGNMSITVEVMTFLKSWLNNHILNADKKYTAFLNAKGVV